MSDDFDEMDEIWALYADDGAQALDAMEASLLALKAGEAPDAHVGSLFRAVHTFKGNSRVLGLSVVESRAHLSEDLIGLVRDEGVAMDAEIVEILLFASDVLRAMLEETAATRADVDPSGSEVLMEQLQDKIARCRDGGEAAAAPDPVAPAMAVEVAPPPPVVDVPPPVAVEAPPVVASPAPAPAPVPDPVVASEPAPAPARAISRLADDPTYRAIFRDMAQGALDKFAAQLARFAAEPGPAASLARSEAEGLKHAAGQMGLDDWAEALAAFLSGSIDPETLSALVLRLDDLMDAPPQVPPQPAGDRPFFEAIADPLSRLSHLGIRIATGETPAADEIESAVAAVRASAAAEGYVRVVEALDALRGAEGNEAFRTGELKLYEELSAVEAIMPEAAAAAGISPRKMLRSWCAGHAFDTLSTLETVLNTLRTHAGDAEFRRFDRLMRLVHHACEHHSIDTAAQLAMSLVDLFSRVHSSGVAPDAMLLHIARGFIETIELALDAIEQGEKPATEVLERLFEEAANVCFLTDGLMTAGAIERRLGLPSEFHRVLSPDSVRSAAEELEKGKRFYIVRTDINDDDRIAEAFLEWLSGDQARSITNVTVFRGAETLFDFLVSSRLDEPDLIEALVRMDPSGRRLKLTQALWPSEAEATDPTEIPGNAPLAQGAAITPEMLETIGEISASQAMVHHLLAELAESDLAEEMETLMRQSGWDWGVARTSVRAMLDIHAARLQEIAQAETALTAQLAALQEETVSLRARPASTVLRPLQTFVETLARRSRREARLTTAGDELPLDLSLLERLRGVLRGLVAIRMEPAGGGAAQLHVSLRRDEERVIVMVQDDGGPQADTPAFTDLVAGIKRLNGSFRAVPVPGGGLRFHIGLPLSMVVLEGMVVGVDGVRYVVPVDAIRTILQVEPEMLMTISAAGGQRVLRISDSEIVAIHRLRGHPLEGGRDRPWPPLRRVFVILGNAGRSVAIPVDELVGQQLVLLRLLRGVLSRLNHLTGLALLAGGDVGMVLSANRICEPQAAEAV
ncbi:two-component system chemotaxis sensor kinase CheA [Cereibacter ovatus]|uniref:histidine kinase n=1 Tax=Cereibacter ovatus TaxID=439529 RepID=A0A285CJU3_9RHOB|nr:Hpt domain-containing protein [Cereibacter ovatus]SNX67789.1 two-component system chemotaxis sensor kinase CheA [Cereibacter ovatus]